MQLLKDVKQFWIDTWRTDKKLFFSEAFGTLLGMTAAGILNFQSTNPNMLLVLILYLISAVLMAYASYKRKSSFLVILMIFYATTSVYGLINLYI